MGAAPLGHSLQHFKNTVMPLFRQQRRISNCVSLLYPENGRSNPPFTQPICILFFSTPTLTPYPQNGVNRHSLLRAANKKRKTIAQLRAEKEQHDNDFMYGVDIAIEVLTVHIRLKEGIQMTMQRSTTYSKAAAKRKQQKRKAQQKKKADERAAAAAGTAEVRGEEVKEGQEEQMAPAQQEEEQAGHEEQEEKEAEEKDEAIQQAVTAVAAVVAAMAVSEEEEEEEECSVCLNVIESDDANNPAGPPLVCGHLYHAFCLNFWVEKCRSK